VEAATVLREVIPLMILPRTQMTPGFASRLRAAIVMVTGAIVFAPAGWLVLSSLASPFPGVLQMFDGPFIGAVKRSLVLLGLVMGLALVVGWPLGVLSGMCKFP